MKSPQQQLNDLKLKRDIAMKALEYAQGEDLHPREISKYHKKVDKIQTEIIELSKKHWIL